MEEVDDILLLSLRQAGCALPDNYTRLGDLGPAQLTSICATCLIQHRAWEPKGGHAGESRGGRGASALGGVGEAPAVGSGGVGGGEVPAGGSGAVGGGEAPAAWQSAASGSLPKEMTARLRLCADLAAALRGLGYQRDIGFHQFLYPNDADTRNLLRFLVDRLLGVPKKGGRSQKTQKGGLQGVLRLSKEQGAPGGGGAGKEGGAGGAAGSEAGDGSGAAESEQNRAEVVRRGGEVADLKEKLAAVRAEVSKVTQEAVEAEAAAVAAAERAAEAGAAASQLTREVALVGRAVELLQQGRSVEELGEDLGRALQAQEAKREGLEAEWQEFAQPLELHRAELEAQRDAVSAGVEEKLAALRSMRRAGVEIEATVRSKEAEREALAAELAAAAAGRPRAPTRGAYLKRLAEVVKNARRADADAARILGDMRELQREGNAARERLGRTYAVLDERVFRDARQDAVARSAYKLLTSLHATFAAVAERNSDIDRVAREAAEVEAKSEVLARNALGGAAAALARDVQALREENRALEKQIKGAELRT